MKLRFCHTCLAALLWFVPSNAFADVILDWNEIAQVLKQPELENAYANSLAQYSDDASKQAGIAIGEQAGTACLLARKDDGSDAPNRYKPRTSPGVYVPTTLPAATEWPHVKPFVLKDGAEFRPGPPPALTSELWARDYEEIQSASSDLLRGIPSCDRSPPRTLRLCSIPRGSSRSSTWRRSMLSSRSSMPNTPTSFGARSQRFETAIRTTTMRRWPKPPGFH